MGIFQIKRSLMLHLTHLMWFKVRNRGICGDISVKNSVTFGLKISILPLKEIKQWAALHYLSFKERRLPSCIWNGSCVAICAHLEKSNEENPLCFPDFLQKCVQIAETLGEILRELLSFLAPILKCNPRKWHLVIKYLFLWW